MKQLLFLLTICMLYQACNDIFVPDIADESVFLIAPPDGFSSNKASINFSWEPLEDAESYALQIVSPNYDTIEQIIFDTLTNSTSLSLSLSPGSYEWSVLGQNSAYSSACCEIRKLFVVSDSSADLSQQAIQLLSPTDDLCTNSANIIFSWQPIPLADTYSLQIAGNSSFTSIIVDTRLTNELFAWDILDEGVYYWRVRAENETSNTFTDWHQRAFTFDATSPAAPTSLLPVSGDTISIISGTDELSWQRANDVASDSILIYNNTSLTTLLWSGNVNEAAIDLTSTSISFQSGEDYFWRVLSLDKAGNISPFSSTQSFFVE